MYKDKNYSNHDQNIYSKSSMSKGQPWISNTFFNNIPSTLYHLCLFSTRSAVGNAEKQNRNITIKGKSVYPSLDIKLFLQHQNSLKWLFCYWFLAILACLFKQTYNKLYYVHFCAQSKEFATATIFDVYVSCLSICINRKEILVKINVSRTAQRMYAL